MAAILDQLRVFIENVINTFGLPGVAILLLVENLFPPIPSELVLPFAGFLVSENQMSFIGVIVAGTVGSVVGAVIIYWIGFKIGERRLNRWLGKYGKYVLISEEDIQRAEKFFKRHGKEAVLIGRLIPGVRSFISLPAGINNMNIWVFLVYTTIGTAIWNSILVGAGLLLGNNWNMVLTYVDRFETALWVAFGLLVAIFVFRRLRGKFSGKEN